jgi:hypothetical protein
MDLATKSVTGEKASHPAAGLQQFVPQEVLPIHNPQTDIPRIAKNRGLLRLIDEAVARVPTSHTICLGDARGMDSQQAEGVHLVLRWVTSTITMSFWRSWIESGHIVTVRSSPEVA